MPSSLRSLLVALAVIAGCVGSEPNITTGGVDGDGGTNLQQPDAGGGTTTDAAGEVDSSVAVEAGTDGGDAASSVDAAADADAAVASHCTDQQENSGETDVDCGGGVCPACAVGKTCLVNTDCITGVCNSGSFMCQ